MLFTVLSLNKFWPSYVLNGETAFLSYLRPITCPVRIPPVMKMEVPITMAPRRALGAISPIYRGCTHIPIPVILNNMSVMGSQAYTHNVFYHNSEGFSFMFTHLTDTYNWGKAHAIYHKGTNKFYPLQKFKNAVTTTKLLFIYLFQVQVFCFCGSFFLYLTDYPNLLIFWN